MYAQSRLVYHFPSATNVLYWAHVSRRSIGVTNLILHFPHSKKINTPHKLQCYRCHHGPAAADSNSSGYSLNVPQTKKLKQQRTAHYSTRERKSLSLCSGHPNNVLPIFGMLRILARESNFAFGRLCGRVGWFRDHKTPQTIRYDGKQ